MFTGLVKGVGTVRAVERGDAGARIEIQTTLATELAPGDSVAVSGCCLTITRVVESGFEADVMGETLARTSLGGLGLGDPVNLELPLRAADRLGGHLVQGHVDAVGEVEAVGDEGFARRLRIGCGPELARYVAHKGSIAVDGVSLTAIDPDSTGFSVALVPETLERTTLGALTPGRGVNLEADVLAKYVERLLDGRVPAAAGREEDTA